MPHPIRRTAALTLLCAGLLLPAATSHAGPAKGVHRPAEPRIALVTEQAAHAPCRNVDAVPDGSNKGAVRAAILCLHNKLRARRGLPRLRENAKLRRAAVGHSRDMVARGYFEHTAPSGSTMVDRIQAARYTPRNAGWSLGENLAWGTGRLATPREIMRAWMGSAGHRANIVKRSYREIGIGIVTGVPSDGGKGATYTANLGVIRR